MNTKRTRRKFSDQQKQSIIGEADAIKTAGGEYKEVLKKYSLSSSVLSKWRSELGKKSTMGLNGNRKASKASKRKIASKLSLNDIRKELRTLDRELNQNKRRREELLSMKLSDIL